MAPVGLKPSVAITQFGLKSESVRLNPFRVSFLVKPGERKPYSATNEVEKFARIFFSAWRRRP